MNFTKINCRNFSDYSDYNLGLGCRHAMKITNTSPSDNSGVWKYTVIPLNHGHVFNMKMYLDPIPQPVIAQNPKLVQNPGY